MTGRGWSLKRVCRDQQVVNDLHQGSWGVGKTVGKARRRRLHHHMIADPMAAYDPCYDQATKASSGAPTSGQSVPPSVVALIEPR